MTQPRGHVPTIREAASPREGIQYAMQEGASMVVDLGLDLPGRSERSMLRVVSSHHYDQVGAALREVADLVDPQPARQEAPSGPEVPEYAEAVADALVAARKRLDGPLPHEVRPLVEREAQTLGVTLGSILARQFLEARTDG